MRVILFFWIVVIGIQKTSYSQLPPYVNALEQGQGRLSGVQITPNRSQIDAPPKVIVRGYTTWNNNSPLYVIDGVQTTDGSLFNGLNPYDIQSITVLKDASAAIYGVRGANGVIIVRTKEAAYAQKKRNRVKRKHKRNKKQS